MQQGDEDALVKFPESWFWAILRNEELVPDGRRDERLRRKMDIIDYVRATAQKRAPAKP